jgi:SAM-dependent methyltransferase
MDEADGLAPAGLTVLDAGCGHKTPLLPLRRRIRRLVGIDLHEPEEIPPYLDAFAPVDLCKPTRAFPPAQFDVVFANFVLEHLDVPDAALSWLARWLRPHGVFVATTVNRRHPFVAAYLAMPARIRDRLQPVVKATSADAHRLVGRCNDPAAIRFALDDTGFDRVELETIGNLARGWKHNPLTFALGILGDLLMRSSPLGRSTIIVVARRRERLTS